MILFSYMLTLLSLFSLF